MSEAVVYRIQSAMVDANVCHAAGFGLGMKGHTEARGLYHRNVIGTVAHGQSMAQRNVQFLGVLAQQIGFGLRINHAACKLACELAIGDFQFIGIGIIQAQLGF